MYLRVLSVLLIVKKLFIFRKLFKFYSSLKALGIPFSSDLQDNT